MMFYPMSDFLMLHWKCLLALDVSQFGAKIALKLRKFAAF